MFTTCRTRSAPWVHKMQRLHDSICARVAGSSETVSPPTPWMTRRTRSLSLATTTFDSNFEPTAAAYVCSIMVLPKNSAKGFPGKRVEPSRAGITPSAFMA
ncbi:hypothetical protein GQ600_7235 [Phytophthora cactorum]|nr:hypothetical protein GQ600_7235 [Phytophthora cactorum]